jgi:hypothetical protein
LVGEEIEWTKWELKLVFIEVHLMSRLIANNHPSLSIHAIHFMHLPIKSSLKYLPFIFPTGLFTLYYTSFVYISKNWFEIFQKIIYYLFFYGKNRKKKTLEDDRMTRLYICNDLLCANE